MAFEGAAPLFLSVGTSRRQPHGPAALPSPALSRRQRGSKSQSVRFGEDEWLLPVLGIEPRFTYSYPARSLFTIPPALYRVLTSLQLYDMLPYLLCPSFAPSGSHVRSAHKSTHDHGLGGGTKSKSLQLPTFTLSDEQRSSTMPVRINRCYSIERSPRE